MARIVRVHTELQPGGTCLGASAAMPRLVARGQRSQRVDAPGVVPQSERAKLPEAPYAHTRL